MSWCHRRKMFRDERGRSSRAALGRRWVFGKMVARGMLAGRLTPLTVIRVWRRTDFSDTAAEAD